MSELFSPRPTSAGTIEIPTLDGMLVPWRAEGAVLLHMPACPDYFMTLFSTESCMREVLTKVGITFTSIKQVDDGDVFLDGLPLLHKARRLRLILDPRFVGTGRLRFTEIQRPDPEVA